MGLGDAEQLPGGPAADRLDLVRLKAGVIDGCNVRLKTPARGGDHIAKLRHFDGK